MTVLWNSAERELITNALLAGNTMGSIAKRLGCTRNVVIGRIARDQTLHTYVGRVVIEKKVKRDAERVKPKTSVPLVPRIKTVLPRSPFMCVGEVDNPVQEPVQDVALDTGKPLIELGKNACRWPVDEADVIGGFLFCAEPALGRYCLRHTRLSRQ